MSFEGLEDLTSTALCAGGTQTDRWANHFTRENTANSVTYPSQAIILKQIPIALSAPMATGLLEQST